MSGLRHLLALLPGLEPGGAEAHTLDILRAVTPLGVRVTLAAEPALLARLPALPGVTPVAAPGLGWRAEAFRSAPLAQQRATEALLSAHRPNAALLPLPWPSAGIGPRRALAAAGVPSLTVAHLVPLDGDAPALASLGGFPAAPGPVVAVSAPAARRLAAATGLAVAAVPNGIAPAREAPGERAAARAAKRAALGLPPEAPLLLFAGRLAEQKGADLLPALAAGLRGATLAVAGEGPLRPALAASPARLLGQVADMSAWLLAADALVMPSRLEGCPLVFLEAAARRCAVLASAAALEAFPAAETLATLLPIEDASRLTAAVAASFPPAAPQRARAEAAWRLAASQGLDAMLRRYLGLLRSLVA